MFMALWQKIHAFKQDKDIYAYQTCKFDYIKIKDFSFTKMLQAKLIYERMAEDTNNI